MLWIKAFHLIFVTSWMAGLFYMPRFFINLAQLSNEPSAERARLLLMARKLYRFTTLLAGPAFVLGFVLWLYYGIGKGPGNGWLHAKLALFVVVLGYHHGVGVMLKKFERAQSTRSAAWYRVFNEVLVVVFAAMVILVVVKPF